MKTVLIIYLTLGCSVFSGWAQGRFSERLDWGAATEAPRGSQLVRFINAGEWGAWALRYRPGSSWRDNNFWLEQYGADWTLMQRLPLTLSRGQQQEDLFVWQGEVYLLVRQTAADSDLTELVAFPLTTTAPPTKLAILTTGELLRGSQFDWKSSRDSSHALLYYQLPSDRSDAERFALRVMDEELRPRWQRTIELPYSDATTQVTDYCVDGSGRVNLLVRVTDDQARTAPARYYLWTFTAGDQQEYRLDLPDQTLLEVSMNISPTGEIVCTGLYTESRYGGVRGSYYLRLNSATGQVGAAQMLPLPLPLVATAQAAQADEYMPRVPELLHYRIGTVLTHPDGGVTLIAEQRWQRSLAPHFGQFPILAEDVRYGFEDLLVWKIRADGSSDWVIRLPKQQLSTNDRGLYASYLHAVRDGHLLLFYNAHPQSVGAPDMARHNLNSRGSVLALTSINAEGGIEHRIVADNDATGVMVLPRIGRQVSHRALLLYGQQRRADVVGMLRF